MIVKGAKILLVDDEKGMCDSLRTLLEFDGFSVTATTESKEAAKFIKDGDFDLVIADIKMPRLSGIDLLKIAHERDPHLEVILMTGYASLDTAKAAVDYGAFGYLTKPVEYEELKLAVTRSLEKRVATLEKSRLFDELAHANNQLKKRFSQIDALYHASIILASTIEFKEALSHILSLAIDVIGAKIGSVMILDPEKNELYIGAACGLSEEIVATARMPLGSSISGFVAESRKPLIVEDIERDPRFSRINRQHYESKSLISVPLQFKGSVLGVINLNNKLDGTPFNEDDLKILASFATQAAIAIDRANIFGERTEIINELSILYEITHKISTTDRIEKVGEIIYEEMSKKLHIEAVFWYGFLEKANSLQLELAHRSENCPRGLIPPAELKIGKEVIGFGQDVDTDNVKEELVKAFANCSEKQGFTIEIIPVLLRGTLSGFMVILSGEKLDKDGKNLAAVVATQAASVYERQKAILNAEKLVTMGKLISEICHDLKKPLTHLKGNFQLYRDKFTGAEADEFFTNSEMELNRLTEMVREVVDSANPLRYYTKKESLRAIVEKASSLLSRDMEKKGITFHLYAEDVPDIELNKNEMLEAILNLLLNSVESMENGGKLTVKINMHPVGDPYIRLTIADTGCGIPESQLPKIFERYYTTKDSGSGLGLAIVERVIIAHNGRLSVESKEGKGTTFYIDLPA